MLKRRVFFAFGICLLFFFSDVVAQENNVNSLIEAASFNTQKDALANYVYQLRLFRRTKSQKNSWLYDAILPSQMPANRICRHSLILVEKDNKPVPYEILRSSRQSAIRELEAAENGTADTQYKNTQDDGGYVTINFTAADDRRKNFRVDLLSLLKVSKFSNLKQEMINGRDAFLIEFSADEQAKLPNDLSYFTKLRGLIWIDTKDKRIVQVEGFPLENNNQQKKKITSANDVVFFFSQFRTREGFWFPQIIRLNFLNHPELQNGFAYDTEYNFENYQHLRVDTSQGAP